MSGVSVEPDWPSWQPREKCTLCFVVQDGKILLIRKKRGLGAGKINGPGGKVDGDESSLAGAIREVQEELLITPTGITLGGELFFQFEDGYAMHCAVYRADGYTGVLTETDEAEPLWFGLDAIPFPQMWADDIHWMDHFLARRYFAGYFVFAGDQMLFHRVELPAGPSDRIVADRVA